MKRHLLLPLMTFILCTLAFSSCDDDYYYDDRYLDRNIVGQWDLIYINGRPVSGYTQNFFDFYSDGSGKYYYYENGQQYWEWIDWWCYDGYSSPVLHVKYSSGAPLNCAYYFNSDATRLYLRWTDSYGNAMEYVYAYTGSAQTKKHTSESRKLPEVSEASQSEILSALRPGTAEVISPKTPAAK